MDNMLKWISFCTLVLVTTLFFLFHTAESCNEAVCASVVSKCMLTQSCKCDLKNCSCCKECYSCLGYLYTECCSCVDMCPKPNDTGSALSKKSHVEDYTDFIPGLFHALTAEPDKDLRWTTFTFPIDIDISQYSPKPEKEIKYYLQSIEDADPAKPNVLTINCTVAYIAECMSWNKCKVFCGSMGATSYRWFHDGCCECIGNQCIKYGINESRCSKCSSTKEVVTEDYSMLDPDELDYGEGMDNDDM